MVINHRLLALINYNDYFDFDGYKSAIKELSALNKEFGKSVLDYNAQVKVSYNGIQSELKEYASTLQNFNVNSKGAAATLTSFGETIDKQTKRFEDQKRAVQGLLDIQDLNSRSINELKAAAKQLESEYNSLGGASDGLQAKKAALAAEYQRVTQAAKMQAAALKAATPEVKFAADSYKALQAELTDTGNKLRSMAGAFDPLTGKINENNKEAVALQKRYVDLNGTLKNIDAGLGNFQRNVGNYKSGFSGLGNSINQITREFPSFANSLQTGFLAISNNLPIFFDELQKTSQGIKALKAEGKPAPTLFKALASSVLSFGTVLSLGVTLLTIYGKDIVEFGQALFKTTEKIDAVKEAQKANVDVLKKSADAFGDATVEVSSMTEKLLLAKKGVIDKEGALKDFNDTIGKTVGLAKSLAQAEQLLIDKGPAYIQLTFLKAQAEAAADLAKEEAKKSVEASTKDLVEFVDKADAAAATVRGFFKKGFGGNLMNNITDDLIGQAKKQQQSDITNSKIRYDKFLELQKKFLDDAGKVAKESGLNFFQDTKDDTKAADRALRLYEKDLKKRQDALKATFDEEVAAAQKMLDERKIDQVGFEQTKFNSAKKYTKAAIAEEQKANSVGYKADEAKVKEFNVFREKANNDYLKAVIHATDESSKEDLELQKKEIEDEAQLNIASIKDAQQYELSNQRLTNEERVKLEISFQNQIDEITIKALQSRAELEIDSAKKTELLKQATLLRSGINNRNAFGDNVTIPRGRGQDNEKDLNQELTRRRSLGILTVQYEIETAERIISIRKKLNLDTASEEAKLLDLRKKQQDEIVSYIRGSAQAAGIVLGGGFTQVFDEVTAAFQKLANGGKLTFDDLARAGIASSQAITEGYKQGIDEQLAALDKAKSEELKAVGNNASAQAAIEAKYAREKAQLETKKAKADRENAIFQIAINTAEAIAKSIAESPGTFGLPFSAYAAAAGALQTALVLSRPLPKFERGTSNAPEGMAVVDEKGPELIIDRNGRLREVGGDGPRVTYLQRGDQVKTASETKRILAAMESDKVLKEIQLHGRLSASLQSGKQAQEISTMARAMMSGGMKEETVIRAFESAIKKIPIRQTIIDRKGERERIIEAGKTITYLNKFNF